MNLLSIIYPQLPVTSWVYSQSTAPDGGRRQEVSLAADEPHPTDC